MKRPRAWRFGFVLGRPGRLRRRCAPTVLEPGAAAPGIDPELVANPIAVTSEVKVAADELSGSGGNVVDQLKRMQIALFDPGASPSTTTRR
jgi:hypothetical protein